ncbi:MAG: cytochrome ubiquinol oxidase subunit I [Mycobacterium sp.]|nr:cytochrome ubiquinol oxidase subunit I [Mycobacterium sp.]
MGLLRGSTDGHHRLGFTVPVVFASVAAVAQPFIGHVLGSGLNDTQPGKLAAFELAEITESPSPLRLGGVLVDGQVRWSLDIPRLGSIIACNSLDAPVRGLDSIPISERSPVNITNLAFQSMFGFGTLLAAVAVLFWPLRWRGHDPLVNRWFLRPAVAFGPLTILAVEFGWVATEVRRQSWTVWQIVRTTDATSTSTRVVVEFPGGALIVMPT